MGNCGDDEDLADAAVGDEDLGAIQDVTVPFLDRCRLGAGGVAACAGFGEAEAAQHFARGEQRHVALLLCVGSEVDYRRRAQSCVSGDSDGVRGVDFGHLMDDDHVAQQIQASAAQLFGPWDAQKA